MNLKIKKDFASIKLSLPKNFGIERFFLLKLSIFKTTFQKSNDYLAYYESTTILFSFKICILIRNKMKTMSM